MLESIEWSSTWWTKSQIMFALSTSRSRLKLSTPALPISRCRDQKRSISTMREGRLLCWSLFLQVNLFPIHVATTKKSKFWTHILTVLQIMLKFEETISASTQTVSAIVVTGLSYYQSVSKIMKQSQLPSNSILLLRAVDSQLSKRTMILMISFTRSPKMTVSFLIPSGKQDLEIQMAVNWDIVSSQAHLGAFSAWILKLEHSHWTQTITIWMEK